MAIDRDSSGSRREHANAYRRNTRTEGMHFNANEPRANGIGGRASPTDSSERQQSSSEEVYPRELQNLMTASEPLERDAAWDAFLTLHSRLLLHVARKVMPASESAMDAYANLLERLRRDDCRTLAGYSPDGRSRFTTWLVVVARRMCVDFYRQRYGRPRSEQPTESAVIDREARRRLVNFVGIDEADAQIIDSRSDDPEECVRSQQLRSALDRVVSALPPEDQLLLKLRFYDALSANQIATVLRLPTPFHVYRRLKTVCAELRRNLIAVGVEDSAP